MRRKGIALVLVLVVLLLVEAIVAGMLALANHSHATAKTQVQRARAETAAQFAAHSVLKHWATAGHDSMAIGALSTVVSGSGTEADAVWSTTVERLSSHFLVRSEAKVGGGTTFARARTVAVARTLDRRVLAAELAAALTSRDPIVAAGSSTITAPDSLCAPASSAVALLTAAPPLIAASVTMAGSVVIDSTLAWIDSIAAANLSWSAIATIADHSTRGMVTPRPVVLAGVCDTTVVTNWGDPLQSAAACSDYFPLIFADDDLTMAGGHGQGMLFVAGVFAMSNDASFTGAVIARDGLTIGPDAQLRGAALARAGHVLVDDAEITHSHCVLAQMLARASALRRLLPQSRRFLPVF